MPLRGKLEADWRRYCISYVTQEGFRYDLCKIIEFTKSDRNKLSLLPCLNNFRETVGVGSERRILRELKPFKSILKFGYIPEGQATNDIKRLIGKWPSHFSNC